jgi:hypothetical protein
MIRARLWGPQPWKGIASEWFSDAGDLRGRAIADTTLLTANEGVETECRARRE